MNAPLVSRRIDPVINTGKAVSVCLRRTSSDCRGTRHSLENGLEPRSEQRAAISADRPQSAQHEDDQREYELRHAHDLRGPGMFHAIRSSSAIRAASWAVSCPGASGENSWAGTAPSEPVKRPESPSSRCKCRTPDLAWLPCSVLGMAHKSLGLGHRKPREDRDRPAAEISLLCGSPKYGGPGLIDTGTPDSATEKVGQRERPLSLLCDCRLERDTQ